MTLRRESSSVHTELYVFHETEKAYHCARDEYALDDEKFWLPKSQVVKGGQVGDIEWEFEIPTWLAAQKGLA